MGAAFAAGEAVLWVDRLSDVMREYLGNRFDFDGLESTTDEIISRLRRLTRYQALLPEIIALLGECDLVQFAKAPAEQERSTELLRQARAIVNRTQPTATYTQSNAPTEPEAP